MRLIKSIALACAMSFSALAAQASTVLLDTLAADPLEFNFSTNPDGLRLFNIASSFGGNTVPYGQSFTLADDTSDLEIAAYFGSFSGNAVVTASLHAGAGFSSAVSTLAPQFVTGPSRNGVLGAFDFSGLGTLTAGIYTVFFSGTGALGGSTVTATGPNQYVGLDTPGTDAYSRTGLFNFASNPARDFGLRVTGTPDVAPIPLPASLPLLLAGIGAFAMVRRRAARA